MKMEMSERAYFFRQKLLLNLFEEFAKCSCVHCYTGMRDTYAGLPCIDFTYIPRMTIYVIQRAIGFAYTVEITFDTREKAEYLKLHTRGWRGWWNGYTVNWDFHVLQKTRLMQFIHWLYDHTRMDRNGYRRFEINGK